MNEFYKKYIKESSVFIIVLIISFFWTFMLTYNFFFFWEDGWIFSEAKLVESFSSIEKVKIYTTALFETLIDSRNLLLSNYYYKPLSERYVGFIGGMLGTNILYHHFVKSMLAGIFFVLIYMFLRKADNTPTQTPHGHNIIQRALSQPLLLLYFLSLPELWILTLYLLDVMLFAMIFEIAALYLFFFYYHDKIYTKKYVCILFFLILFFSYIAILAIQIGRINFLLFSLFLLITDRKKLLYLRNITLIVVLLFFSFPIVGIIGASLFGSLNIIDVIGLNIYGSGERVSAIILSFFKTINFAFFPQAFFLVILSLLFILLHTYGYFKIKSEENENTILLKKLLVFNTLWFVMSAFAFHIGRGLVFDLLAFLRFEYTLFLIPMGLMLIYYPFFVYKKYFATNKFLNYVIILFVLLAIFHNLVRLNEFRGGWGAYVLGYNTVREYVDENADGALLLVRLDHAIPTYFPSNSTNDIRMQSDLTNMTQLLSYKDNYTRIFVTSQSPMQFDDSSVVNIANLTIKDTSPYGLLKRVLGHYYRDPMYLYEVK